MIHQTPHAAFPPFTDAELAGMMDAVGPERTLGAIRAREEAIAKEMADPFRGERRLEPEAWRMVDEYLADPDVNIVALFGANRTSKSWYAAKRIMQTLVRHGGTYMALAQKEETSIAQQQKLLWRFTPAEWQALNTPRAKLEHAICYNPKNGFADGKVVWPNRSELYCVTYRQDPFDYEGWEFGSEGREPVVGVWADESMPLKWLQMLERRIRWRGAKLLWSFTPVSGLTPAMKEFLGNSPRWLQSQVAELLPTARIPGLPAGHMPVVAVPWMKASRAIWWHVGANPFANYTAEVKRLCADKSTEFVERVAYGYARDTSGRLFPAFGSRNIVADADVPARGTNYMVCDPAEDRNWFTIWVRVTPGNPATYYVYREWPDEKTYGEWAVPTERETTMESRKGWDGDRGPAQNNMGYGPTDYWKVWTQAEFGEKIEARVFDSRAAGSKTAQKEGTISLLRLIEEACVDACGKPDDPGWCREASGVDHTVSNAALGALLEWHSEKPLVPGYNAPHLYVAESCRNVIWALNNYTGMSGETGASKDVIDCLRYMATGELEYVDATVKAGRPARGFR